MPLTQGHLGEMPKREPVAVTTVASTVLVLLAQFGVPVSDTWANIITAVIVAVGAVYARSKVSPVAKG